MSLLPTVYRTYSKKGQRPVLRCCTKSRSVMIAGAIAQTGRLFYEVRTCRFNAPAIVRFLRNFILLIVQ